ncbi:putative quinol monooxygenase [Limoniibacter endophyticus]|uniref:ABM domain-containing protein n=1 Tax=Limoniibacter endophyticus TaxID=1565040 RepID=A0A8J3DLY5_9HYPH|nr:putative quinol monooxygenase [Limoniibacter endophyticus]GHC63030.1 hypothetical protein GCM10010136_04490 [Limoniibacter endophyticus]
MSVTYEIVFHVKPEKRALFLSLLSGVLDAMRHEDTFISATLHEDPSDPLRFMLIETWQDHQDVLDVQLARPYRTEWHASLPALLKEDRLFSLWRELRNDSRR